MSLYPLTQDAGGKVDPAASPGSEPSSSCAGSPAAADAGRELAGEPYCTRASGVRCCRGCQPHWLRFPGRKAGEELGVRFPRHLWEGSIAPGQGLNPLQRSLWGKALDVMHMEADALKPLPAEISSCFAKQGEGSGTKPPPGAAASTDVLHLLASWEQPGYQPGAGW